MSAWGTFPAWSVGAKGLGPLRGSDGMTGAHIAAMKVFMAVALEVDFHTRESDITNDRLMHLTGLSRPMLRPGIDALEGQGILQVDSTKYRNRFRQVTDGTERWSKIPTEVATKAMRAMSNRGLSVLAAWKIYLKLLESRNTSYAQTLISHRKLVEAMSLPTRDVAAGIDHLVNHSLVHVRQHDVVGSSGHPVNQYNLLGQFRSRPITISIGGLPISTTVPEM
ncbi:hypothetical protein VDF76_20835 [Xanthomonas campestris pv. raphani]|uniref:hypothetical protein n=1 Tax=Xanthomonas campestris TaxID=339 RepID=UPI002B238EF3|nr:hypothetical protein [Xanthomonas campestris]MEA9749386.1 hypothetical protein [Xanthomonas campestris pv. raphani]